MADGDVVATTASYKVTANDLGKKISLRVEGIAPYTGSATASAYGLVQSANITAAALSNYTLTAGNGCSATAAFQETHPNVNVVLEVTPNEAYKTAIQVALSGSDAPDIFFNWSGEDSNRLIRDGLALDITDLAKAEGQFGTFLSPSWLSAFEKDGRIYGAATDAVTKYFY